MPYQFKDDCLDYVFGRDSFKFDEWTTRWAQSTFFRITGLNEALQPLNLTRKSIDPIKSRYGEVAKKVPTAWQTYITEPSAWGALGRPQIEALMGRRHQTFTRALHSLVYVADHLEVIKGVTLPDTFFDPVKIVPVIFHLEFENGTVAKDLYENHVKDDQANGRTLETTILRKLSPCDQNLVQEAILGGRMTYRTAEIIQRELKTAGIAANIICSATRGPGPVTGEYVGQALSVQSPVVYPNFIRNL